MEYSKQDIKNFKKINIIVGIIGILFLFLNIKIGGILLVIAIVGYFAPFKF